LSEWQRHGRLLQLVQRSASGFAATSSAKAASTPSAPSRPLPRAPVPRPSHPQARTPQPPLEPQAQPERPAVSHYAAASASAGRFAGGGWSRLRILATALSVYQSNVPRDVRSPGASTRPRRRGGWRSPQPRCRRGERRQHERPPEGSARPGAYRGPHQRDV